MQYINSNENEKSFLKLYDKYYKKIYNYIFRSILHKETAEDLTSNTFFKALDYIKKKNPKIKNFSAWIYKIATNELLMHLRYKRTKNIISLDDEAQLQNILKDDRINPIDKHIDFLTVKKAMENLKPLEMIMIDMHFFENKNYSEMSKVLKIKENTLRSKMHRILQKMNKLLTK